MGCVLGTKKHDPTVPRCAANNYPRNPAYANQPQTHLAGPVNVGIHGGRDHMGEVIVAGALLSHGGYGVGGLGPTMHNPVSGGYGDMFWIL